jgi:hypothetical protein
MATDADRQRLARIRMRHEEASRDWSLHVSRGQVEQICARLAPGTEPAAVAVLTADCSYQDRDFLLNAHRDIGFLLDLLAEAFRRLRNAPATRSAPVSRKAQPKPEKKPDYAAECAMKCAEPIFIRFLTESHGLETDDAESIKLCVRKALDVASRSELNKDPEAAARWTNLRAAFDAWRMAP